MKLFFGPETGKVGQIKKTGILTIAGKQAGLLLVYLRGKMRAAFYRRLGQRWEVRVVLVLVAPARPDLSLVEVTHSLIASPLI